MRQAHVLVTGILAAICTLPLIAGAQNRGAPLLPGTRPNVLALIQGNALSSDNASLVNLTVRLRDARTGRIVELTTTDKAGFFAFRTVDPGSYVVELVGRDQTIIATSQILNVNAGETVSALVRMPFRIPPFARVIGHSASSAAVVTATAAASGVLAMQVAGSDVTPRK